MNLKIHFLKDGISGLVGESHDANRMPGVRMATGCSRGSVLKFS